MSLERISWTRVPDVQEDRHRHAFAKFGRGKAFSAIVCLANPPQFGRWTACIVLRLRCKIVPDRLERETLSSATKAKAWVRCTAATLGLLLEQAPTSTSVSPPTSVPSDTTGSAPAGR